MLEVECYDNNHIFRFLTSALIGVRGIT